jgi:prepilin-type N-terminal cleavage/methylation domain-containing protein
MTSVSSAARRGFTLIELLVVIAIIGILSSVVLASLNTARNKGNDASVKSNLAEARSQAELFYDANGNNYVVGPGTAFDVCNALATAAAGPNGVRGIYPSVYAAASAAGIGVVSYNTAGDPTHAVCNSTVGATGGWGAQVPLKTGGFYCVDNTGTATSTPVTLLTPGTKITCS